MNYTIKEFIESNKFPKMQLISDNSGINRVIRGVQILSVPNMEKFLGGGGGRTTPYFFGCLRKPA